MLYKTLSAAVYGIDANIIEVEVDVSGIKQNEDRFHTVGLPDAAVRESRDRVRAALKNCGYDIPPTDITINLAPADIRKEGSGFDLPMALGILGAYGGLNKKEIPDALFVGELSLDGSLRGVRGALPIAIEARGRKGGAQRVDGLRMDGSQGVQLRHPGAQRRDAGSARRARGALLGGAAR